MIVWVSLCVPVCVHLYVPLRMSVCPLRASVCVPVCVSLCVCVTTLRKGVNRMVRVTVTQAIRQR